MKTIKNILTMEDNIMSLVTWHALNPVDTFFDTDPFLVSDKKQWETIGKTCFPKVNVIENEHAFHLEAEIPGLKDKDISIEVHNGILTIKGSKQDKHESRKENYHIREFNTQSFERNFTLSNRVDTEQVSAKIEYGVLKVDMPIHEQVKPKKIDVVGVS